MPNGDDKERLSVNMDPVVIRALNVYAASQNEYVYVTLESFIRTGLKAKGTSVEALAKVGT